MPLAAEGNGHWSVDVPGAAVGQQYTFIVGGQWRIDPRAKEVTNSIGNGITLEQAVEAFEGKYIVAAMSASRGNVTQASKALGVHRNTLHNKLRTQTMLNGFAESIRPSRRRVSAKRVSAPPNKKSRRV